MSSGVPFAKRAFRMLFKSLPASHFCFNLGKAVTHSILKTEKQVTETEFIFNKRVNMRADLSEFVSNDIYCIDKHYEAITLKAWQRLASKAHIVLDIGSHIGTFALIAASINLGARILAVEICRENLKYLEINASKYRNIEIFPIAIGSTSGRFIFQENYMSGGGYLKTQENIFIPKVRHNLHASYQVDTITLSELCQRAEIKNEIDLIKIDIEGLEYELLTKQDSFWSIYKPKNLFIEIGVLKQEREKMRHILEVMRQRGYNYKKIENIFAFPWKEKIDLANWYFWKT